MAIQSGDGDGLCASAGSNLVATAPLLRDRLASPSPRGSCFLKYFWAVAVSLAICSDIPRSRHHRIRKAKLGMPSVAKMGPSTADTGEMRPTTPWDTQTRSFLHVLYGVVVDAKARKIPKRKGQKLAPKSRSSPLIIHLTSPVAIYPRAEQ